MSTVSEYKYYAFISYSRKNSRAAAFLHRGFERFRFPAKIVRKENLPPDKKYMKPIFRDKRDLEVSEKSFQENLNSAIEFSHYLVVLCSPEAAVSEWVQKEIEFFLATHDNRLELIVPVVLSGIPGSNDEQECLPEPLRKNEFISRNLPRMTPDEGETEKVSWGNGLIQAISYMLGIKKGSVKSVFDAEQIRFYKRSSMAAIFALMLAAGLTIWALNAEQKAKEQADLSKDILQFVEEVFQSTDPFQSGDKDTRIMEALQTEIPEIQKIGKWQLKASVSLTIGTIMCHLGEYEQAMELLELSVALYETNAPDSLELSSSYLNLAMAFLGQRKFKEALHFLQKAERIREKKFGEHHLETAEVYAAAGTIFYSKGSYDKALEYYNKALIIRKGELGENHLKTAEVYNHIGNVYNEQGKHEEALEYFQKTLEIQEKNTDANHPDRALIYNSIGMIYLNTKKYPEAITHFEKALQIFQKTLGEDHPHTAVLYYKLGTTYEFQQNRMEALNCYKKALAISTQVSGEKHHFTKTVIRALKMLEEKSE
ncbi:MAG: toll/interleukin-1 receptor domain-containing protein [Lentisphaeria bacterium]|nr:toll/interleukin-1 receptor domain-containing protein [Lentisphaeria bacterium]